MTKSDTNDTAFAALLAAGEPVLIDGGLATQCEAMGCDIDGDLWSARLLRDDPDALVNAHRAFLDAGARVIATATYQASRRGFTAAGLTEVEADGLMRVAVELAARARDEFLRDNPAARRPLIAASIGPYGAILHDGSEYTGRYGVSAGALREFHAGRLEVMASSAADLLACETIPNRAEARVLCELLRRQPKPAWVSFSCRDEKHLADGTDLVEVAGWFRRHPTVLALGVNCVAPECVVALIGELRQAAPDKVVVAYPNSGETWQAEDNTWHGGAAPLQCEAAVIEWLRAGATLVGGCCRIGPRQIAAMATAIGAKR